MFGIIGMARRRRAARSYVKRCVAAGVMRGYAYVAAAIRATFAKRVARRYARRDMS